MRREDIPEPSASTFKDAQDFIREYRLSQWRLTNYLVAVEVLSAEGIMPTDTSIARYLSDKRSPAAVERTMTSLIEARLVRPAGETARGKRYELTDMGEQAVVRVRQIRAAWLRLWEEKLDPPQPDYSKAFERLNHQIKSLEATIQAKDQALEYQAEIISNLRWQLSGR